MSQDTETRTTPWAVLLAQKVSWLAERASLRTGGRVPVVLGVTALDCGAASLAMTIGYHGRQVTLDEVRQVLDVRQGTSADQIIHAARAFGMIGQGVRAELDDLDCLDPGTILHWEFDHFVVFEGLHGPRVRFIDPIAGKRELSREEFGKSFTGVALVFETGADFQPKAERSLQFRRYLLEVLSDHGLWLRILLVSLLLQVLSLSLPLLTGAAVETIIPRADRQFGWVVAAGLGVAVASNLGAMLVRGLLLLYWRTRLDGRLMPGMMSQLLSLPYEYFEQRLTAELVLRLGSATAIRDGLTSGVLSGMLDGALVLSYSALVLWISPGMGAVVLGLALVQAAVLLFSWQRQRLAAAEEIAAGEKVTAATYDILRGVEGIKAQGLEEHSLRRWIRHFIVAENAHVRRAQLGVWVDSLSGTVRLASPLVILLWGAFRVMSGSMSLGTMLALNAVAMGIFLPIGNLVQTAQQLIALARHVERVDDVFRAESEAVGAPGASRPLTGAVALRGVSFQYSRGGPYALRDVSFECRPGELIALVGRSGSGKSTLAKLIAGLYAPTAGEILYDGAPALGDVANLRQQLGYVAQRPAFMGQSIRLNIASLDPQVPLDRIHDAARVAAVHEEILQLPMGYETMLLNDGCTVSGGQRQRIALAQALVRTPRILILDEATSALDTLAENEIYARLRALHCTRIMIAHRLSTITRADRIVVLDGGRIAAIDTHARLLETCAVYRQLVESQAKAE